MPAARPHAPPEELTCLQSDVKGAEEVKLRRDRESWLLTGKTYSCFPADPAEKRDVTITGQKMFHNFTLSAEKSDNTATERFIPKNIKLKAERDKEEKRKKTEGKNSRF